MAEIQKEIYHFGAISGIFVTIDGSTEFVVVPEGFEALLNDDKLSGISPHGKRLSNEPILHISLAGDGFSRDFSAGTTLRNSDTALRLRFKNRKVVREGKKGELVSEFEDGKGLCIRQHICFYEGINAIEMYTEAENFGPEIVIEALPSFNLSCISPFRYNDDPSKIIVHKLMNNWSGEGKLFSVSAEKLCFEPSWSGLGIRYDRISQTGTMPAKGYLPFIAVEDTESGVCWAAAVEAPCSWIIETVFRNNGISIGGGGGDWLSAHWRKSLKTGETLQSGKAYITAVKGNLDSACAALVQLFDFGAEWNIRETDLPVLYNEYCYTWGYPEQKCLEKLLPAAAELGCKYFVVDAGWYKKDYGKGGDVIGDWYVEEKMFPKGLADFSEKVSAYGMKTGLLYEFEGISDQTDFFSAHSDLLLTYHGKIINHEGRCFLDFRKPETWEYLREKVIDRLLKNNIGYIKVDYNENIGLGVDGEESYGENLRKNMQAVVAFFKSLKNSVPDLVLEICSSGGMRHEPGFLRLADMVSFSDAHENPGGVPVAMNLHRFIPPRKMQVWATIREDCSEQEAYFTLAKAMLGRICFSGNFLKASDSVRAILRESVAFYNTIKPILKKGRTTCINDEEIRSYFRPEGKGWLVREDLDGERKLVYAFSLSLPRAEFSIEVGEYFVEAGFNLPIDCSLQKGRLIFSAKDTPFWGTVIALRRRKDESRRAE